MIVSQKQENRFTRFAKGVAVDYVEKFIDFASVSGQNHRIVAMETIFNKK